MTPLITIVGMGTGISQGVAEKFGAEGYAVAMIARNEEKLQAFKADLEKQGITANYFTADAGNAESLQQAFNNIKNTMGDTSVLLYNAALLKRKNILEETAESIAADLKVNVGGALEAVKIVLPAMQTQGEGTLLFTGGGLSLNPSPLYGSLAIGKAGLRNLVGSLYASLKDSPIKVATITVSGFVSPDSERHTPQAIGTAFWNLHQTPKAELKFELVY
jgi:short-subunit dehydrogenase